MLRGDSQQKNGKCIRLNSQIDFYYPYNQIQKFKSVI